MKRIRIDFAPASFARTVTRMHAGAWLVTCVALLLSVGAAGTALKLLEQQNAQEAQFRNLAAKLSARTAPKTEPKKLKIPDAQAISVNAAIAQLNLPWRDMLDAIEVATPATIALLAVEPNARKQSVRGTAEAKGSDAMIGYIESLKRQPFFRDVTLIRHEVNEQDPNRPLRFQFEIRWAEVIK